MVRFAVSTFFLTLFLSACVFAQDTTPKIQVFGGYSIVHADLAGLNGTNLDVTLGQPPNTFNVNTNFTGWNAEGQYNLNRWIGLVADLNGRYGQPFYAVRTVTGVPNSNAYSFLFGPSLSYHFKSPLTPFIHALFGLDRTTLDASTIHAPYSTVIGNSSSFTDFAAALGGGIDYKITKHFSIRPAQVDWFHTTVNLHQLYGGSFGLGLFQGYTTHQANIRYSAGLVFRF